MGKKSAPTYNASAAIASQQAANDKAFNSSAQAAGRSNPFGTSSYSFDSSGRPTGTTTTLADPLNQAAGNIMGGVSNASSWLPSKAFSLADVPSGMDIAGATFNQGMNWLSPQMDRQNKALEAQLYQRGIPIGQNDVYRDATQTLGETQGRTVNDLIQRSLLMAPQEQQRQIQNAMLERNQGYDDVRQGVGLLGGIGSLAPQAANIGNQQSVDAMGAYKNEYQSQMAQWEAKQKAQQELLKLGGSLLMAPLTGGTSLMGMGASLIGNQFMPKTAGMLGA